MIDKIVPPIVPGLKLKNVMSDFTAQIKRVDRENNNIVMGGEQCQRVPVV